MNLKECTHIDIRDIMRHLPHRYPFLLVDRVLEFEPDQRILAQKNVTINEHFFSGHFQHYPVMPGVLMIEALAQVAGVLSIRSRGYELAENELYFFVGIDGARFKRQVVPGDVLLLDVGITHRKRDIAKYKAVARVGDEVACVCDIMCARREL